MDLVQKEHDRLLKKLRSSQGITNVQNTIDILQSARDAIAAGESRLGSLKLTRESILSGEVPVTDSTCFAT